MPEKTCPRCGITKMAEEFYSHSQHGRYPVCAMCCRAEALIKRKTPRYREKNRATQARYRAAHPERRRATRRRSDQKRHVQRAEAEARRRARQHTVHVEKIDRLMIYSRDHGRCHICGRHVRRDSFTLDHLIPLFHGGPHASENLAVAHAVCNSRRGPGWLPAQLRLVG